MTGRQIPVPQAVVRASDGQCVALLALPQGILATVPLERVADGARQQPTVQIPLGQIILRAFRHRLNGHRVVLETRQDDDGHLGVFGIHSSEGVESLTVRQ